MINQDSAILCARGASMVNGVREHMREKGSAYLVVTNAAGDSPVEGVRLWEVKWTPSSRSTVDSSRGSVRSKR